MDFVARVRLWAGSFTNQFGESGWLQRNERTPTVERAALIGIQGAIALMGFGTAWDLHWHATVGRDSPWIPPHLAVYAGTALAAAVSSAMVLGTRSARKFWHDPYAVVWTGSYVTLVAAVADAIWHQLIGDGTLWSPPHALGVVGAVIVTFGNVIGWRWARSRGFFPSQVCRSVEILVLASFFLAAYYGLRGAVILAFHADFSRSPLLPATSPYVAAAMASLTVPAVVLWGRGTVSRGVDMAAILAVSIWMVQELLHGVLTPWAAAQQGTVMAISRVLDARFALLTLVSMLVPPLVANRTPLRGPVPLGVALAGLYVGAVAVWLAIMGQPASVSPSAVATIGVLGGLSAWAGAGCARWISRAAPCSVSTSEIN